MKRISISIVALVFAAITSSAVAAEPEGMPGDLKEQLLKLSDGARVKIVWQQNEDAIVGFDTATGAFRTLFQGRLGARAWPLLTPDGETVLFGVVNLEGNDGKAEGKIHALRWSDPDGTAPRELCDGLVPAAAWKDPASGETWIYMATKLGTDKRSSGLKRFKLSNPSMQELVWDRTDTDAPLSLSADGRFIASQVPWPNTGLFSAPNGSSYWTEKKGCNANILPDNSYRMFHVDFDHRGIYVYENVFRDDPKSAIYIKVNVDGGKVERVRTSNHPRFATYFGPMGSKAGLDVFAARFAPDFKSFEGAVRLTQSKRIKSTLPHLWVDPQNGKDYRYALGQFVGEAPFPVSFSGGNDGNSKWDFGDGSASSENGVPHTYTKPGEYAVRASDAHGNVREGRVFVLPQKAPAVERLETLGATRLQITFDERVQLKQQNVTLASGDPIAAVALQSDERTLTVDLEKPLRDSDELHLDGIVDKASHPNPIAQPQVAVRRPPWPSHPADVIAAWAPGSGYYFNAKTQKFAPFPANEPKDKNGRSLLDRFGRIRSPVRDVFFASSIGDKMGLPAEEFALEVVLQPRDLVQSDLKNRFRDKDGAVSILSWADSFDRPNFILGQLNNDLVLKIGTSGNPAPAWIKLAALTSPDPCHLILSFRSGKVEVFLNGRKVNEIEAPGDLKGWKNRPFNFVRLTNNAPAAWRGWLDAIAVYKRAFTPQEVEANCKYHAEAFARRKIPRDILVEVKPLHASQVPTPQSIAPYQNALLVNEYEVVRSIQGKVHVKTIRIAEWGIADGRKTTLIPPKNPKPTRVIRIQKFEENPQLETELRFDTLPPSEDFELYFHPEHWIEENQNLHAQANS